MKRLWFCDVCGVDMPDFSPTYCCSGFECDCKGMPSPPPICSAECGKAAFDPIGGSFKNRRKAHGIPWRGGDGT